MKPISLLGLAAIAALALAAFVNPTVAAAESTALCAPGAVEEEAKEECGAEATLLTGIHYVTAEGAKAKILNAIFNVACDVLLAATSEVQLASPLIFRGHLTYTNCGGGCTVEEENGPTAWKFLKNGAEEATVVPAFLIHVHCGASINCLYKDGEEIRGEAKGAYLVPEVGQLAITEQALLPDGGAFCPKSGAKLDIVLYPLVGIHFIN